MPRSTSARPPTRTSAFEPPPVTPPNRSDRPAASTTPTRGTRGTRSEIPERPALATVSGCWSTLTPAVGEEDPGGKVTDRTKGLLENESAGQAPDGGGARSSMGEWPLSGADRDGRGWATRCRRTAMLAERRSSGRGRTL